MKEIFTEIYNNSTWKSKETPSGTGSELLSTTNIRKQIPIIFEAFNIKKVLDVGCGDCNWVNALFIYFDKYLGVDVVPELIQKNIVKYETSWVQFICDEVINLKIQKGDFDVALLSDVFVHLPYADIISILWKLKQIGVTYLLMTNFIWEKENRNIKRGDWRRLCFTDPPFNFPFPIISIDHSEEGESAVGKTLGLWKFEDLKL